MKAGLFQNIITAVFPDRCLFCGNVAKPDEVCCGKCAAGLPWLEGKRAEIKSNDPFAFVAAPFVYKDGVRRAIGQLKFHGHKEAGEFFAAAMLDSLDADFRPDWVVSVPMNPDRPNVVTTRPIYWHSPLPKCWDAASGPMSLCAPEIWYSTNFRPACAGWRPKPPFSFRPGQTLAAGAFCWWMTSSPQAAPCAVVPGCCGTPALPRWPVLWLPQPLPSVKWQNNWQ